MKIGTIVMYNGQLCKIMEVSERSFFSGQVPTLYYTIAPVDREEDSFYVTAKQAMEKCRPLLTEREIEIMRVHTAGKSLPWIGERYERSRYFTEILQKGDPEQLILLIRCLLDRKAYLASIKKKLTSTDEKILSIAEKRIDEEFSYVLKLPHGELMEYFTKENG